jgi:hypothetical protein
MRRAWLIIGVVLTAGAAVFGWYALDRGREHGRASERAARHIADAEREHRELEAATDEEIERGMARVDHGLRMVSSSVQDLERVKTQRDQARGLTAAALAAAVVAFALWRRAM